MAQKSTENGGSNGIGGVDVCPISTPFFIIGRS